MRVDEFDFALPEDLIALRPAAPRDAARLLVVGPDGAFAHTRVSMLPELLRPDDVLVVNDTKVLGARLAGIRPARDDAMAAGAKFEATLHKRLGPASYLAFARPAKRLKPGDRLQFGENLGATVRERNGGEVELAFDRTGSSLDDALAAVGEMPLPPYIAGKRKPDGSDRADYQTIYASNPGAVAAPTAGLHFTDSLLARLGDRGIAQVRLTLHVGPGTFLPVTAERTEDHRMHGEWACLSADAAERINSAKARGGRVVAVGSTALRTLESASDEHGRVHAFKGDTALFITPGYRFRAVDVMLTNFHLPRSTLFMLVCAFSGMDVMKRAYRTAIDERYRFYSYGDASLLFRPR